MEGIMKLIVSEENLTIKEKNVFIWSDFLISEEENLTDEEKKAWR